MKLLTRGVVTILGEVLQPFVTSQRAASLLHPSTFLKKKKKKLSHRTQITIKDKHSEFLLIYLKNCLFEKYTTESGPGLPLPFGSLCSGQLGGDKLRWRRSSISTQTLVRLRLKLITLGGDAPTA